MKDLFKGRLRCSGPSQEISAAGLKSTRGKKKLFCVCYHGTNIRRWTQVNTMIGELKMKASIWFIELVIVNEYSYELLV